MKPWSSSMRLKIARQRSGHRRRRRRRLRIAGDRANGATEAAPAPAMMAMPVPVSSVVKKTLPIYLDIRAHRIDPATSLCRRKCRATLTRSPRPTAPTSRPAISSTRSTRAIYRRRSIRRTRRRSATRPRSNMRGRISDAARNWSKAASSPRTPTISGQHHASGRGGARA